MHPILSMWKSFTLGHLLYDVLIFTIDLTECSHETLTIWTRLTLRHVHVNIMTINVPCG